VLSSDSRTFGLPSLPPGKFIHTDRICKHNPCRIDHIESSPAPAVTERNSFDHVVKSLAEFSVISSCETGVWLHNAFIDAWRARSVLEPEKYRPLRAGCIG
jgi:hypothetical protein